MKINWIVRLKNPTFVMSFIGFIVSTAYQFMAMFDIAPMVTEDALMRTVASVMEVLTLMGVMIDPTTKGISDSERAMTYEEPN